MPLWLDDALRAVADRENLTYSALVERAVQEWIRNHHPDQLTSGAKGGEAPNTSPPPAGED
jgi:hypothetical protein